MLFLLPPACQPAAESYRSTDFVLVLVAAMLWYPVLLGVAAHLSGTVGGVVRGSTDNISQKPANPSGGCGDLRDWRHLFSDGNRVGRIARLASPRSGHIRFRCSCPGSL